MELLTDDDPWTGGLLIGAPVELKLIAEADAGSIEGYGATFDGIDHGLDTVAPGAFADSLRAHHAAGTSPAMLWAHRNSEPVGKWTAMGEDARGLRVRGVLNLESTRGREAYAHVKNGDTSGLSIGFQIAPGGSKRATTGNGRTLTKLLLHEVSLVSTPMDPGARIANVKAIEIKSVSDLRALLRDAGLSRGAADKIAGPGFAALAGDPTPDPAAVELVKALDRSSLELKALRDMFR